MSKYLIACDDGHGMETAGKRTPALKEDLKFRGKTYKKGSIIHENDLNEYIMEKFIEGAKRCGIDTLQVAPGDSDIPLATRVSKANSVKADLYISFHANALAGDKWQEKAYGLVVIKHDKCQAKTDELAKNVYDELKGGVNWYSNGGSKYGVRKDIDISGFSLYVLRKTNMPSILVEYGFMDNVEDVKRMVTEEFSTNCAEATLKGACKTLGIKYIPKGNVEVQKPQVSVTPSNGLASNEKYIRVKVAELNVRNKASWKDDAVCGVVKKGDVYTLAGKVKVDSSYLYKLKSGLYITASPTYVEVLSKI